MCVGERSGIKNNSREDEIIVLRNYAKLLVYRFPPIAILGERPPLDARTPVTQRHIIFSDTFPGLVAYIWRTGNIATTASTRKKERNALGLLSWKHVCKEGQKATPNYLNVLSFDFIELIEIESPKPIIKFEMESSKLLEINSAKTVKDKIAN